LFNKPQIYSDFINNYCPYSWFLTNPFSFFNIKKDTTLKISSEIMVVFIAVLQFYVHWMLFLPINALIPKNGNLYL